MARDEVDIAGVAALAAQDFAATAEQRGSSVTAAGASSAVAIGDEARVAQIARVLVDNALRHNPPGVEVTVTVQEANGNVELVVADDGPPIEPSTAERLFDRFFRGPSGGEGSGLGLAIANELAQRMEGELVLDQRAGRPGKAFRLTLPGGPAPGADYAGGMSRGWIVTLAAAFGAGLAGGGVAVLAGSVDRPDDDRDGRRRTGRIDAGARRHGRRRPRLGRRLRRAGHLRGGVRRAWSPSAPSSAATPSTAPASWSRPTATCVTNAHVVTDSPDHGTDSSDEVKAGRDFFVHFQDGNALPAKLVGFDLFDDVAVLKVDPAREPLTVLQFGRARQLKVGDPLAVIGSPFGEEQEQSLSVGVVAALNREIDAPATDFTTPGIIQTDAAINHGNSGGPVLDSGGRVVGVASQILTDGNDDAWTGIGFAVPAEAVERSYRELVDHGRVSYAWLGVATRPLSRELARTFKLPVGEGLLVNGVTAGGPAAAAGPDGGLADGRVPGRRHRASGRRHPRLVRRRAGAHAGRAGRHGGPGRAGLRRARRDLPRRQAPHGPGHAGQPPRAAPGVGSLL